MTEQVSGVCDRNNKKPQTIQERDFRAAFLKNIFSLSDRI